MIEDARHLMADILGLSPDSIDSDTTMAATEAWDSLKHMELVAAFEEGLGISPLTAEEIVQMTNFKRIVEILGEKTG